MSTPAMTPQQAALSDTRRSAFSKYKALAVGVDASLFEFVRYEVVTGLCSMLPGIVGLGARAFLYPGLFGACLSRPAIGRGVLLRNMRKISLGKNVIIDDYAVLDVRGAAGEIEIGDHVCIGRFSTIVAKDGKIHISKGVNIGSHCRIATQSAVSIGESVLVAAYAYIGPGNHQDGEGAVPLISQAMEIRGGVKIGAHSWIGTRATVMDGVTIGERATVAAHAFVKDAVPAHAVVGGIPARLLKGPPSTE